MAGSTDGFDWTSEASRASTVVPEQRPIAIYWNPMGALVIRQQGDFHDNEDPFVFVQPHYLPALIQRLREEMERGPDNDPGEES